MLAMGVLCTTTQTMNEITIIGVMETTGPNSDTNDQRKEDRKARDLDLALRTWLRRRSHAQNDFNTKWASRSLAVDLVPTAVHDIGEERYVFVLLDDFTKRIDCSSLERHIGHVLSLAVRMKRSLLAGGENMDEQGG